MTKWEYWVGWGVALTLFWAVGFFVIKLAILSAHWYLDGKR